MKCGRLTDSIYDRSVVKVVRTNSVKNKKYYDGAGLRADCAILVNSDDRVVMVSGQAVAQGRDVNVALRAYIAAVNNAVGNGADTDVYVNMTIIVPEYLREIKVRNMLERAVAYSEKTGIPVLGIDVQVIPSVNEPVVSCVACGCKKEPQKTNKAEPDEDIIITKCIGLEGTAVIAAVHEQQLMGKYHRDIVEQALNFERHLSVIDEIHIAQQSNVTSMQVVREGGVFGALWGIAERNHVGINVDLRRIPIKQETVEVCEFFDINPYELLSGGSLLFTIPNGKRVVEKLREQGIEATMIGRTIVGNDRIIRHEDELRYLEPSKSDEIFNNRLR